MLLQVLLTVGLRALHPYLPYDEYPASYAAIILLTAYFFGEGPAVLALAISFVVYNYYFIPPEGFAIPDSERGWARTAAYFTITGTATFAVVVLRRRNIHLRSLAAELEMETRLLDLAHILIKDANDRIVSWNTGAERLYGYTREEAIGRNAQELLRTAFLKPRTEIDAALDEAGYWQGELVHTAKDGRKVIVASHHILQRDAAGRKTNVIEVNNDITEQKLTAEALRESKANTLGILDAVQESVWMFDAKGIVVLCNAAAAARLRMTPEEAIGKSIDELISPALARSRWEQISRVFETSRAYEWEDQRDSIFFSHVVYPVMGERGEVSRAVVFSHDITDRKRAEQRERELEAHKRDFYRRTILAATDGKLQITEKDRIAALTSTVLGSWHIESLEDVSRVRDEVIHLACAERMQEERVADLVACVVESSANALKHAGGGDASLHGVSGGLLFVVSDNGPGIGALALPDVALTKGYSTSSTLGMGYKVMIRFADRIYLYTGPDGTTVACLVSLRHLEGEQNGRPYFRTAAWTSGTQGI